MYTVCGGHRTLPSHHRSAAVVVGDQRGPGPSWWQIRRDETFLIRRDETFMSPCSGGGGTVKNCVAAPDSCERNFDLDHGHGGLVFAAVRMPWS